jgi:hypothetical protein
MKFLRRLNPSRFGDSVVSRWNQSSIIAANRRKRLVRYSLSVVVFCTIVAGTVSSLSRTDAGALQPRSSEVSLPDTGTVVVSVSELARLYEVDEPGTDARLRGRNIDISGRLASAEIDLAGRSVLYLETNGKLPPARMELMQAHAEKIDGVRIGSEVLLRCQRVSRFAGTPLGRECDLVRGAR